MNFLEKEIEKRGITMYKLCNVLGKNPSAFGTYLKSQLSGEKPIEYNDYITILKHLNIPENPEQYDKVKVRVK